MAEELEPAELLPVGTTLHRRYTIDGVLGRGTYGITYFGHDEKTGTRIALKEYFPYALADRAPESHALTPKNKACGALFFLGSEMFYRQHLALTDAKGSENCVTVYTAFFENGTSYAVMERLTGVTLERYLQLRRRKLFPDEAMYIAASLADALLVVHSLNSLHYDINARSIFLCTDGTVKLVDFGAAKAGLRARQEVDDTEPWVDIAAVGKTPGLMAPQWRPGAFGSACRSMPPHRHSRPLRAARARLRRTPRPSRPVQRLPRHLGFHLDPIHAGQITKS